MENTKNNHLAEETSPYLQQHVHNPVDWYPWNEKALTKAREQNKPILLSIGYAACHWCHVMAHESFEDEETARLMNRFFINIKVDREERPDLDKIYQMAHYFLSQRSGGWPLTVFLTADDLTPFFSGTYFPREKRYNLPAFKDLLTEIADIHQHHRQEITQQNQQLLKAINYKISTNNENITLSAKPILAAKSALQHNYDAIHGGFTGAPKFPLSTIIEFLLRDNSTQAKTTLQKMAEGGIYDQLGGGFFRYTIDAAWQIPHFEKMLYDNAQLLFLYALVAQQSSGPCFANVVRETGKWLLNTMQAAKGGFFSSLDADSEGHEGKFYLWNKFEVAKIVSSDEYKIIYPYFGLDKPANFESEWHLHVAKSLVSIAAELNLSIDTANQLLASAKEKLLLVRAKRIAPACDKKILTAWNSLLIKAFITAGNVLTEPRFLAAAEHALSFIQQNLWKNNRLLASYHDGKAHLPAYLDDYAFLLDAIVHFLQIHWNTAHLRFAIQLADTLLNHFYDTTTGGFFFTADDHEKLLHRPKTMADESLPSGNGIAARALISLGHLLGESRYLQAAEKTLYAAWNSLEQSPGDHCTLLMALQDHLEPPQLIVIRGNETEIKVWQDYCKQQGHCWVFAISNKESNLPGLLATRIATDKTCAYVCQGTQCLATIENFAELKLVISKNS